MTIVAGIAGEKDEEVNRNFTYPSFQKKMQRMTIVIRYLKEFVEGKVLSWRPTEETDECWKLLSLERD